jgi:hypothetical protein
MCAVVSVTKQEIIHIVPPLCSSTVKLNKRETGCIGALIIDFRIQVFFDLVLTLVPTTTRHTQRALNACASQNLQRKRKRGLSEVKIAVFVRK